MQISSDLIILFITGIFFGILFTIIIYSIRQKLSKNKVDIYNKSVQLDILLNTLPDYIYIKDAKSRFVAVNKKHLEDFKFDSEQKLIGKRDIDLYPEEFAGKFMADEEKLLSTGVPLAGIIEKGLNDKGEPIFLSTTKYPIYNKEKQIIGLVGISRDVTHMKENEQNLFNSNKELQQTNEELIAKQEYINEQTEQLQVQAKELEYANEQLTELIKTRDKFFSIIAHDLKNPVNLLRGFSDLLIYRYKKLPDEKRYHYIVTIHKNTNHLADLLEKLLQWARMQTGGICFEPEIINISAYLEENLSPLKELFVQKNIKISLNLPDSDKMMLGDRNMLDFVLRNLVTNAIKYTNKGGEIAISCEIMADWTEFCVLDTGVGIDESLCHDLFSLTRNKTREGTEGEMGTGLGLFLCKDFIERNRGKIWCESKKGEGTRFYFRTPSLIQTV
jgi:PAS domain S-box-containing protein